MHHGDEIERFDVTDELVSVAKMVAFIRAELETVAPASPAAQLYGAFLEAIEQVYRLP